MCCHPWCAEYCNDNILKFHPLRYDTYMMRCDDDDKGVDDDANDDDEDNDFFFIIV